MSSLKPKLKPRSLRLTGLLAGALVIVACATVMRPRTADLSQALKFSHRKHAGEADCGDCHGDVAKATSATRGRFIPKKNHGGCGECHEDAIEDKAQCKMCHVGADLKIELTRVDRHLKFSHAAHAKRVKDGCKSCHAGAYTATKPAVDLIGTMAQCADACHKQQLRTQQCSFCHSDLKRFPVEAVGKLGHGGDLGRGNYLKRHGALARNAQNCAQCHDQTYCADCHARTASMPLSIRFPEKVGARFIHRGDYLGRHAAEARAKPATCRKCHGAQHCSSCHERAGLSPALAGATAAKGTRQVHGPGNMTPGAADFHGRAARRDINRCASCHDRGAASNCVDCHKVGQLGGNPHPRNFRWRDKASECRSNSMCATCHTNGAGCP